MLLAACSKSDPVLPGDRVSIFRTDAPNIIATPPTDLGKTLEPKKCDFTLDSDNRIWRGERRIFAGLPTDSKIKIERKTMCNGGYVYAGLSTGELVKVNAESRNVEWVAEIFSKNSPTSASPFLDIIATPVYADGFVYAGGLGNAFCKIRDKDGAKSWCLPLITTEILRATDKFAIIKTPELTLAVSRDGKVFELAKNNPEDDDDD